MTTGIRLRAQSTPLEQLRVSTDGVAQTYSSGALNFVPAATPTDIAALWRAFEGRAVMLKRLSMSGIADAPGSLDVLLQRSPNGGLPGSYTSRPTASHDSNDFTSTGGLITFGGNRTAQGNGIDNSRPLIRAGRLVLGTPAAPAPPLDWTFGTRGDKALVLNTLVEWIVINLNGQTLPSGLKLSFDVEWSEEMRRRVIMWGDSTTSNANFLFQYLRQQPHIAATLDLRNYGNNGVPLSVAHANGTAPYPESAVINAMSENYDAVEPVVVICFGLNDLREGLTTQAAFTALLDATIASIKAARPDCRIILWGPNPLTTDGNSGNFVTLQGTLAGKTLPQAAQWITDVLYNSYESFKGDPRIWKVVQKQDISAFGRTCKTVAASGLMTDILHPNAAGQKASGMQIERELTGSFRRVAA